MAIQDVSNGNINSVVNQLKNADVKDAVSLEQTVSVFNNAATEEIANVTEDEVLDAAEESNIEKLFNAAGSILNKILQYLRGNSKKIGEAYKRVYVQVTRTLENIKTKLFDLTIEANSNDGKVQKQEYEAPELSDTEKAENIARNGIRWLNNNSTTFGKNQTRLAQLYEQQIASRVRSGQWSALAGKNGVIDRFISYYASNPEQVGLPSTSSYESPTMGKEGLTDKQVEDLRCLQRYAELMVEKENQNNLNQIGYKQPAQEVVEAVWESTANAIKEERDKEHETNMDMATGK